MPNELPAFLQDFIKHRQHVVKSAPDPKQMKANALTPASKVKDLDTTVKGIIEKSPAGRLWILFYKSGVMSCLLRRRSDFIHILIFLLLTFNTRFLVFRVAEPSHTRATRIT